MKFTKENLANAMGVKIGDKILVKTLGGAIYRVDETYHLRDEQNRIYIIQLLFNEEYEILPRKTKLGEIKCDKYNCSECPLNFLAYCRGCYNHSLYECINHLKEEDPELYVFYKKRLDKEIE